MIPPITQKKNGERNRLGAFFCVCPFHEKFLKKKRKKIDKEDEDEEMRERSRWWLFFQALFFVAERRDKKKISLSALSKSKVDNNPPKSLFCA